jgi:hypothetical protein
MTTRQITAAWALFFWFATGVFTGLGTGDLSLALAAMSALMVISGALQLYGGDNV